MVENELSAIYHKAMHSITNGPEQSVIPVTDHLARVLKRIAAAAVSANRAADEVRLLAVSKGQSAEKIRAAFAAGQRAFGENYLQEALQKMDLLRENDIEWHFIGRLQSNKTRGVAEHFAWVHTLDRLKIAQRLNDQRPHHADPLNVCVQVNLTAEKTKGGVAEEEVEALCAAVESLPRLRLRGLMTIPPMVDQPEESTPQFRQLASLMSDLGTRGLSMDTLSMGMSADLEVAIREGATIVRVGTAIFGPRREPER